MFARLVTESLVRNPRRKLLAAAALMAGMTVASASLTVALEAGDQIAREFRSLGANLLVTPKSDTLPVEIGGVDYRPVSAGAYLDESDLGKLKMIFWRHNILGFTPFLDVPARLRPSNSGMARDAMVIGTWYEHAVPVPDGTMFATGLKRTHPGWKIRGRWFADGADECVLGEDLAGELAGSGIGQSVEIEPQTTVSSAAEVGSQAGLASASGVRECRVVGIVSTGEAEDQALLVPLSLAQKLAGKPGKFRHLFVSALTKPADALAARDPATLSPAEYDKWFCSPYISSISYQIEQSLPGTTVQPIRKVAETEGRILGRVSALLWLVTISALLAAALGVAATAASTVLERRSEIGIMKAIGGTNLLIGAIFICEQLLIAAAGGAAGFGAGVLLARALGERVFGSPAPARIVVLPAVLGLAALVAIVGSLIPLRRAARFDPAPILRGE